MRDEEEGNNRLLGKKERILSVLCWSPVVSLPQQERLCFLLLCVCLFLVSWLKNAQISAILIEN